MLTTDVRVEEFDAPDWLVLHELVRRYEGGESLSGIRAGVPRAIVPRLADELARRLERGDDALAQAEKLYDVLRDLSAEGAVLVPAEALRKLRAKARLARRLVDALCPPGKTVLFAAFENGDVRTSVALHRGARGFDRIVGPSLARGELGLVSGDWKRDSSRLARAVELGVGPLSIGCFAELHVWRRLVASPTPGAWASAVAAREILFHPVAPAVAIPLGVDVGRAAVAVAREILTRFGVPPLMDDASPLRPALDRMRDLATNAEVERRLGFDPLAVLSELFASRPPRRD
jgi:hypothetical protein